MGYFLLKTEPTVYSFADLLRDQKTVWDGIANALALQHLRTAQPGDHLLIYHTGNEKAAVGTARVDSKPYPDPHQNNEKMTVVDIAVGKALPNPVTLAQMKATKVLAGWDLLRLPRLSVVPMTREQFDLVRQMSQAPQ